MRIEDCINDPEFRVAFVEKEIEALKEIIEGNKNVYYYNEAKISIYKQMVDTLKFEDKDFNIMDEHLKTLVTVNEDISKQKDRFLNMISMYEKFLVCIKNSKKEVLKLVQ